MYKKIRKSVADVLSTVQDPEQFQWNKWIKEPQIFLERFPKPRVEVKKAENFNNFKLPSLYQVKKFSLTKFKISEDVKNVVIKKRKTFRVFINFPKIYQRKVKIFDSTVGKVSYEALFNRKNNNSFVRTRLKNRESVTTLTPNSYALSIELIIAELLAVKQVEIKKTDQFKYDCSVPEPLCHEHTITFSKTSFSDKVFDFSIHKGKINKNHTLVKFNKLEKKPSLTTIPIITLDEIKSKIEKVGAKEILFSTVNNPNQKSKLYNIKLQALEPQKISPRDIKDIQLSNTRLKSFRFVLLDKVKFKARNLFTETISDIKVKNPGILSQLFPAELNKDKLKHSKVKTIEHSKAAEQKAERKIINWEDFEPSINHLKEYQKEDIKLLLNNRTTLLCDSLGVNNRFQIIHALSTAMNAGIINNALIVCPDFYIGSKEVGIRVANFEGWENQIFAINPSLPFTTFRHISEIENAILLDEKEIYITNYKTLIEVIDDESKKNFYQNIKCLILDEAQHLLNEEIQPEQLFNFPEAQFNWILSSLPPQIVEEQLIPKLKNHLVGFKKLDAKQNRTIETLSSELPSIIRTDYWLNYDSEQAQEFENTLLQGQKRISDLIKGGNPFIIQSNIFTLIHQIKQLGNFSTHKETSPKSALLLDHLETIIASGQKCIVFSQYDKQGLQKIEKLLQANQIRHVLFQAGMSLKDIEKSANSFRDDPKIRVLLAGLTASNMKIKIPEANYIIHFDQWWSPNNQWQLEDKISTSDGTYHSAENICSINYFNSSPIDIKIRTHLQKCGFLERNIMEFLSNDSVYSLINNEDWFDILGIEYQKSIKNQRKDPEELLEYLSKSSDEENSQKIKTFFTKLGYKNLTLKPNIENKGITIYGIAQKGLTEIRTAILYLPFETKDPEAIHNFIKEASKHNNRMFIVCNDEIINQTLNDNPDRIVYIDQNKLAVYFSLFNIA